MRPDIPSFRKLAPAAQLAAIRGERVERAFNVDRASIDEKTRTAWLSIASEEPYQRWWGVEILDVRQQSIRDERLRRGAPLLVGHDTADQVGVVENFAIVGKRLRILARFGKSARAEEIWQDVLDGIRRNTSVGYVIHDLVLERSEGDINTYRVTDWEPLEGSLVAVPADFTVGVGRSLHSSKGNQMHDADNAGAPLSRRERKAAAHGEGGSSTDGALNLQARELARQDDLRAAGQEYRENGGVQVAEELIRSGGTMEDFRRLIMVRLTTSGPGTVTAEPYEAPFGYGARERLQESKYFKGEDAQERAYRAGMWLKAQYGNTKAARWCADHGVRAMSGEVLAQGGALVPGELSSAVIDLADTYGAFRSNADVWPMSSDTLTVPKSTGDPSAAFVSESGSIPESAGTWGAVNLVARKIGTTVRVPTELMEDSVISIADRVAFELSRAFMKLEDQSGFLGDGTSTYGGMSGIFTSLIDGTHNASKISAATNHDVFAKIDATDISDLMGALPEYALEGAKFYCSGTAWQSIFGRLLRGLSGNAASDVAGKMPKYYAGYPVVTSPVLPAGASTDYSGQVILAFGNLRLSSKFGARRDITIKVLTETYAAYDQVGIQGTERFIIVNHDLGSNTVAGPMVGLVGAA